MSLYDRLFPNDGTTKLWVLIDPDKAPIDKLVEVAESAEDQGAGAILIGGSFLVIDSFDEVVRNVKSATSLPVVIFPGGHQQLSTHADGILFMSLLSGRNPQYLIGEQVRAAPLVRRMGLEAVPTAYLLIESGNMTSALFVSDTHPIPRDKPMLVAAHAMAAELFGMKAVYLEAGSGAGRPVPPEVIAAVRKSVRIPIIAGGGITTPKQVITASNAGARAIVVGTAIEQNGGGIIRELVGALG